MNTDRRQFLKLGFLSTGAMAVGATGVTAAEKLTAQATDKVSDVASKSVALTVDGKLVNVPDGQGVQVPKLPPLEKSVRVGVLGRKWVMVIDLAACDGCGKCTEACGKMHFIPPDREWIRVYQMQDNPESAKYWFPKPCFHCDNPPCTKVCPVDATFKREDGVVLIDNERCIGCRFCMAACPYSTRVFNWAPPDNPPKALAEGYSPEHGFPRRMGTVEKCDFCPHMAAQGKLPACTSGCPMGAIYYGDQNEDAVTNSKGQTYELSKLLRDRAGYRHLEELGTEPRVYYLPPVNRQYPAPGQAPNES